jgi:RNA ligase
MQNLDSYFKDKLFLVEGGDILLRAHCDNNMVRLAMSERLPHLGILHYRDDVVFGRGSWNNFNKTCRGVVVDFNTKRILTKPFRKFFNLGESHAPSISELERKKGFWVTEKLDGSFIMVYFDETTKQFYTTTKGSLDSEQGLWAQSRLPKSVQNKELVTKYTLMFEMISKEHQIVIPYDKIGYEEGLYLIGVRENISEKLFDPVQVAEFAKEYDLRTYKTFTYKNLQSIVDDVKILPYTSEGYVIRFMGEELMVKVKSSEYLRVHRFLSSLSDKNLLDIMIAGEEQTIHDNLGVVPEEYRDDVLATLEGYKKEAHIFRGECYTRFASLPRDDRKTFALAVQKQPSEYKKFLFNLFDGEDVQLTNVYQMMRRR